MQLNEENYRQSGVGEWNHHYSACEKEGERERDRRGGDSDTTRKERRREG